jgi:hypothetical protein
MNKKGVKWGKKRQKLSYFMEKGKKKAFGLMSPKALKVF